MTPTASSGRRHFPGQKRLRAALALCRAAGWPAAAPPRRHAGASTRAPRPTRFRAPSWSVAPTTPAGALAAQQRPAQTAAGRAHRPALSASAEGLPRAQRWRGSRRQSPRRAYLRQSLVPARPARMTTWARPATQRRCRVRICPQPQEGRRAPVAAGSPRCQPRCQEVAPDASASRWPTGPRQWRRWSLVQMCRQRRMGVQQTAEARRAGCR